MARSAIYEPPFDDETLSLLDDLEYCDCDVKFVIVAPDESEAVAGLVAQCRRFDIGSHSLAFLGEGGRGMTAWIGYD